jgi:aldehyde:ferredoxin oxidoreductase
LGYGTRIYDYPPYRAVGPVTVAEYVSRTERYDKELREEIGVNPDEMTTLNKINLLRRYREERYEQLVDAVYKRRGWSKNGVPTLETASRLGIDIPEIVEMIKKAS